MWYPDLPGPPPNSITLKYGSSVTLCLLKPRKRARSRSTEMGTPASDT